MKTLNYYQSLSWSHFEREIRCPKTLGDQSMSENEKEICRARMYAEYFLDCHERKSLDAVADLG